MPSHESSTVLVLSGLDGGNPLAFLAAIGTLRAVTRAASLCRMDVELEDA